jgi:hypothetical protein
MHRGSALNRTSNADLKRQVLERFMRGNALKALEEFRVYRFGFRSIEEYVLEGIRCEMYCWQAKYQVFVQGVAHAPLLDLSLDCGDDVGSLPKSPKSDVEGLEGL